MPWRGPAFRGAAARTDARARRFEAVVLAHLPAAHALARWLTGDAQAAQDVVQDAVLRALTYFDGFRDGDAKSWLLRIVRNVAHDRGSAAGRTVPDDGLAETVPDPADDPEAALARRQREQTLERRVAALPALLRECLVLRELEEMTYRQISEVTGVPVGTVMSRLWRARQMLLAGAEAP